MSRLSTLAYTFILLAPSPSLAQVRNLQGRALATPSGMAVPGLSVAGAEEPTALEVNPAGTAFVGGPALHYYHQGHGDLSGGSGMAADGVWLSAPLGPIVPSLAMQWIRPADGGGPRFRKTTYGLSFGTSSLANRYATFGLGWNSYASPDPGLDDLHGLDLGLTLRLWPQMSLGFAVRDLSARLNGHRLPVHYDLGIATRRWRDRLTLSADLLTQDQGTNDFLFDAVALGAGLELGWGLGLAMQLQFPASTGRSGPAAATYGQLALTFNRPHMGVTASLGGGAGAERTWLAGARLSAERYPSLATASTTAPQLDLAERLSPPRSLFFEGERDPFGALLRDLQRVRDDPSIPAVTVRIEELHLGHGRIEELRRLLLQVKERKPVIAYLVNGGLREYALASAASAVLAPPSATFFPLGLSTTTPFLREGLSKIGVGFDVVAIGPYKNAPDPLIRSDMSPAQREATDVLLDEQYGRLVKEIADARSLPAARVRALLDRGLLSSEEARTDRLIDAIAWPDEVEKILSKRLGRRVHVAAPDAGLDRSPVRTARRWGPRPTVALIRVEGTIAPGKSREPFGVGPIAGAETLSQLVREAVATREVVALVLRIDSPGGDALASDLIWRALIQARRAHKPVVISMGDVAASGGYLIAAGADAIVAEPSTLTGSIGIFAVKPDFSGLLDKLGVNAVTLKRGEHADLTSLSRRWTDAERAAVRRELEAFYATFVSRVAEGRHLPRETVEASAGGRVFTGAQALARGLIDQLGSLEDAVREAQKRAGFPSGLGGEPLAVRPFEADRGFLADWGLGVTAPAEGPLATLAERWPELRAAALSLELGPLLAMPVPGWLPDGTSSPLP